MRIFTRAVNLWFEWIVLGSCDCAFGFSVLLHIWKETSQLCSSGFPLTSVGLKKKTFWPFKRDFKP